MKKLFALLLAAMMCLGTLSAMAEGLDLTGVEAPAIPEITVNKDAFAQVEEKLTSTSDIVEVDGNVTKVTTDGVTITFDQGAAGGGYLVLTQDIVASITAYMRYDDPYSVLDILVSNDINMMILDLYTNGLTYLSTLEPDRLTAIAPNLANLSAADQKMVASILSESATIINANGEAWIYGGGSVYVTIVNGWYVVLEVSDEVSSEDVAAMLGSLSVSAAK